MSKSTYGTLIYRATRDGLSGEAFHSLCDGIANTISIIRNNLNYVFGGYASSAWKNWGYISDPNSYIFSLRRNGKSFKDKFTIKNVDGCTALYGCTACGPSFGRGHDFCVWSSDTNPTVYSHFGYSYNLPDENSWDLKKKIQFLAGVSGESTITEIEVYQID